MPGSTYGLLHDSNIINRVTRQASSRFTWEIKLLSNSSYIGSVFSWDADLTHKGEIIIRLFDVGIALYDRTQNKIVSLIYPEEIYIQHPKFYNLMRYFWRNMTSLTVVRYKNCTKVRHATDMPVFIRPGDTLNIGYINKKLFNRLTTPEIIRGSPYGRYMQNLSSSEVDLSFLDE
jgi:hypothetical protein